MRAPMRADGMASHLRCDLAESAGPGGAAETGDGLHTTKSDVEIWLRWPPGGYQNGLAALSGSKLLANLFSKGNDGNMYINPTIQRSKIQSLRFRLHSMLIG